MNFNSLLLLASILYACGNGAIAFTSPSPITSCRSCTRSTSSSTSMMMNADRRSFLHNVSKVASAAMVVSFTGGNNVVNALDMDAFVNSEIANDTAKCDPKKDPKCIPKLSKDEALCQYGGGGNARGEACMRVRKAGGKLPEVKKEKSLGGAYAM